MIVDEFGGREALVQLVRGMKYTLPNITSEHRAGVLPSRTMLVAPVWAEVSNTHWVGHTGACGPADNYLSGTQLLTLMDMSVNMDVFRGQDTEDNDNNMSGSAPATNPLGRNSDAKRNAGRAFNAFMRLQLVRQKASSVNNAMIAMRDSKGRTGLHVRLGRYRQ
ncbi:hypothetical protein DPEC_G00067960 [Dallia pectoralis]|uniref:Uncharacterized protein n=1 Tax=Dallia pectoralis TaxID=75939 RepID=A0ACC2H1H2_DALPE|nr:hypothetical protein DPEC_G00067960 [Dallia pectoralis]